MTVITRKIIESPLYQGVDEEIPYGLTITPWGASPTSISVVLKDVNGVDVSTTHLSGVATVSGNVITLPVLKDLVADTWYRLEVKYTLSGNTIVEAWAEVYGEE